MSEKSISIIIRAKNAMASGLKSAGSALQSFGSGVLKVGKRLTVGFLAGATALAAFAAKAISAYSIQEAASRGLAAAIDLQGQSGKKLLPLLQEIASAIQDQTGADDEAVIAGMAKMRMLGVQTSKLGEAARAVVALKGVDMDEAAAQKAVAMAMQGNYTMLQRLIPALKMTTDATEKSRIVNDFFAKGYEQQKSLLNTVSGQWGLLKERIGNVWEELGAAIAQNEGLMRVLRRAGDAVKRFGEKIREWVDSERFQAIATSIEGIVAAIGNGGADRAKAFEVVGNVLKFSLLRGAELAAEYLKTAAPAIGRLLGAAAKMAWDVLTGPAMSDKGKAREQLKAEGQSSNPQWVTLVRERAKEIQQARLIKEYGLEAVEATDKKTEAQLGLDKALKAAADFGAKAAAAEKVRSDAAAKAAADAAAAASANAEKKIAAIVNETAVVVAETDKQKKARADAELKATSDFLSRIKTEKASIEELAKSRVQTVIDKAKAVEDEEKSQAKDAAKAARLEASIKPGSRLGKKQQEWLDAYNKIDAAKTRFRDIERAEQAADLKLKKQQEAAALVAQQASAKSLKNIESTLGDNLSYAE